MKLPALSAPTANRANQVRLQSTHSVLFGMDRPEKPPAELLAEYRQAQPYLMSNPGLADCLAFSRRIDQSLLRHPVTDIVAFQLRHNQVALNIRPINGPYETDPESLQCVDAIVDKLTPLLPKVVHGLNKEFRQMLVKTQYGLLTQDLYALAKASPELRQPQLQLADKFAQLAITVDNTLPEVNRHVQTYAGLGLRACIQFLLGNQAQAGALLDEMQRRLDLKVKPKTLQPRKNPDIMAVVRATENMIRPKK